jgi:uncharacterized membrane protein YoaK (UPF0700 family)
VKTVQMRQPNDASGFLERVDALDLAASAGFALRLPIVLSLIAGAVDTTSFLGLQGLFSAHVTGNFVLLAATLIHGNEKGTVAKLLSLPVFMLFAGLTSRISDRVARAERPLLRVMLPAQGLLLMVFMVIGVVHGRFIDADTPMALLAGMPSVAAMGVQNGLGRLALQDAPPTTVMTGNLSQLCVDLARVAAGRLDAEERQRALWIFATICAFTLGCAIAAIGDLFVGFWCLLLPLTGIGYALLLIKAPRRPVRVREW